MAKQAILILKNVDEIIGPFKSLDAAIAFGKEHFPNKNRKAQELVSLSVAKTLLKKKV